MVDGTQPFSGSDAAGAEVRAILGGLRRRWWLPMLGALVGFVGAAMVLRAVPPEHTASLVVAPTARTGAAGMGARVPVPAGREVAAAVAEPGASEESLSDFSRFLHLLTALPVAERVLADADLLRSLYPERWDAATGRWHLPTGPLAAVRRAVLGLVGREDWSEPDALTVAGRLARLLVVEPVGTGPMRRVRVRHPDRAFALALLTTVARRADEHLRAEALRRTAAQIAHVRGWLETVSETENKLALAELLADQQRLQMMIAVDLPFAADPVEPPAVGRLPDWPDPLIVLPLATAAGLAAGAFAVGALATLRSAAGERC